MVLVLKSGIAYKRIFKFLKILLGGKNMTLVRMNRPGLVRDLAHQAFLRNFADSYYEDINSNMVSSVVEYNVSEADAEFKLELAVPGLTKEDLVIELENGVLSISTSIDTEEDEKNNFAKRQFAKRFKLSEKVDQDKISASTKNGILTVTLPKVESAIKKPARTIDIE